jgi:YfdX protein
MKLHAIALTVAVGFLASSLIPASYCKAAEGKLTIAPEKKQEESAATKREARSQAGNVMSRQRKTVIVEAASALVQTKDALRALDLKKPNEAVAALERASGKLNIVLARDPKLALAPIDVNLTTYDVYTTLDAINKAREQAEDYLDAGEVQNARALLSDLASEIVVSVVNIPLKTYPDAIAAAVPLIDRGKINEAKAKLETALSTLVTIDHVIPLPLLRAEVQLNNAEVLAQKKGRSEKENKNLALFLAAARHQVQLSEALGYGHKQDYEQLYSELDNIEDKTNLGQSGTGFFDRIKGYLSNVLGVLG